jgi:hypothetical protein
LCVGLTRAGFVFCLLLCYFVGISVRSSLRLVATTLAPIGCKFISAVDCLFISMPRGACLSGQHRVSINTITQAFIHCKMKALFDTGPCLIGGGISAAELMPAVCQDQHKVSINSIAQSIDYFHSSITQRKHSSKSDDIASEEAYPLLNKCQRQPTSREADLLNGRVRNRSGVEYVRTMQSVPWPLR